MHEFLGFGPDFRLLFQSSPSLYLVLKPDSPRFTVVACSDSFARGRRTSREQILGRGILEVFPNSPDEIKAPDSSRISASLENVLESRTADVMPLQHYDLRVSGEDEQGFTERWWRPVNSPVFGADGELLCIIHRVEEKTECVHLARIAAEQKRLTAELEVQAKVLRESEERARLAEAKAAGIVSIAADAIISVDEERRITLFNEGAEKIFGYAGAEVVGAPLDILIPKALRAIHRQHVERYAAGEDVSRRMGERGGVPIFGRRKNGEEFPVEAALSNLEVGSERILTVVLRDITEQKRVEREQRFLADLGAVLGTTLDLEETLSGIADVAVRHLADLCVVDLEEAGEVRRLKVVARDPAKAWVAETLVEVPFNREPPNPVGTVLETGRPVLIENVTSEDIASWAQSEERLRALRDLDVKSIVAVPLVAKDDLRGVLALVSATRAYGPNDLRLAEEIARRAALEIENARLYRASERAIQVRENVMSVVAHDLRNPLTAIMTSASLVRLRVGASEYRSLKPLDMIERAAGRMSRLIEDLLDVGRLEAGHLAIERGRVRTEQVVADAVESQKALADSASLDLQVNLATALSDIWADRDRISQVLENLIGNAVKFTQPGGRIAVGATPRDGETLIWVADTGLGLATEDIPHLFDRFWKVRKEGKRATGAGLGLSIVKGIVEAHGGRVWVESTAGKGSTFCFTIPDAPRAEASRGSDRSRTPRAPIAERPPRKRSPTSESALRGDRSVTDGV